MKDDEDKNRSALRRARDTGLAAAQVGFDWDHAADALDKVSEEVAELAVELADRARATDELGDLLFAVVNVARKLDIDPDAALDAATDKFEVRFALVLEWAAERGGSQSLTLEELEALWQRAKRHLSR